MQSWIKLWGKLASARHNWRGFKAAINGWSSIGSIGALVVFLLISSCATAGPIDFALDEYNAAIAARHLKWKVKYELTPDPPETYHIEPYAYGGAHVTGGDLRGLMYGLLEAAEQIRATGRLKQIHNEPATPVRAVRMFANANDLEAPETFWRMYFQTLARDRFNRFTIIFRATPANFEKLRTISQIAEDYAIDFMVGFWDRLPQGLAKILAACPLIRSVEIRSSSEDVDAYRNAVFRPLRDAGRRVALDPQGTLTTPALLKAAKQAGVALQFDPPSWPASFSVDLPREFEQHAELYWLWGHAAYDRKLKPGHGENPQEFQAAARITTLLAAAQAANPQMFTIPEAMRDTPRQSAAENDWIASIPEAVRDRLEHAASAKQTPIEIADALLASAAALEKTDVPDFRLLVKLARFHAYDEGAAYEFELFDRTKDGAALDRAEHDIKAAHAIFDVPDTRVADRKQSSEIAEGASIPAAPRRLPRPTVIDVPVKSAKVDDAIGVTLRLGSTKDVRSVRLHYRAADSAALTAVIEKPAAAVMNFTIPGASSDLIYYFEILNSENSGWFEPDPEQVRPYYLIRIEPKP